VGTNVLGIILAGGKGTRLKELTLSRAKPALSFAGKYRLIDFVLSNCTNSGIEKVGVLTQYEPLELNSYLGAGSSWGLDVYGASLTVIGPYMSKDYSFSWQGGTAEAVILNMPFIEQQNPDYLLVLSADHIYKMDYRQLIEEHIQKEADLTISTIKVPKSETHHFGMVHVDNKNRVIQFEEKPSQTSSQLASMGVYVISWKTFRNEIFNLNDAVDIAQDVIPYFIKTSNKIYTYEYHGYWRDVGTIESYWKAHMDLLESDNELGLYDLEWPIFSKTPNLAPHRILSGAKVQNSWLNEGSMILGQISDSIIGHHCVIEKEAVIHKSVILSHGTVGANCWIEYAIIGDEVVLPANTTIKGHVGEIALVTKENLARFLGEVVS